MKELIRITEQKGKKAVSARELHAFLESKQEFTNWIKYRIAQYGFVENQDYVVFDNFIKNPSGGRPLTEYALTVNMAKELSMVEGNDKGKQARRYFIDCEQKALMLSNKQGYTGIYKPDSTMIVTMTLGELKAALLPLMGNVAVQNTERRLEYGIRGIAKVFGCSTPTAQRLKNSGAIDAAIVQVGRKIVVDADLALELAGR